ncbi:hypothetical protein BDB00DRAFT_564099 [Zychaea mexicana]|uniref:uncharacterized protein n=1 Tax=Zychaea mexicana TaxID=64656 RepID=UPI0022FF415E|nr:uncharacterized protein BDB00DRAFT_564099 [Zychaea mexicana]KAI9490252.1 hypothetical protein BDB00DRAFT_564099 [Zychaea mexicana]
MPHSETHGCTLNSVDPALATTDRYNVKHIEQTVYNLAESDDILAKPVTEALQVIEEAYKEYGLEATSLSFNGGKDCTVLLHLVVAALSRLGHSTAVIRTVYVTCQNPFPHVDEFVKVCSARYRLDTVSVPGPMREGLEKFLNCTQPKPKAIFVGIRRNDPYAENLTHFDLTDKGWPEFMRVHPIVDWTYKNIWDFLIRLRIPYCSLYDDGYTSLGSMENTHPNPDLARDSGGYLPAYMLENELHERCGRSSNRTV